MGLLDHIDFGCIKYIRSTVMLSCEEVRNVLRAAKQSEWADCGCSNVYCLPLRIVCALCRFATAVQYVSFDFRG